MSKLSRVCVVGAGPSGLVATKTLLEAGLAVDCHELSSCIGGHWVFDNPNGRSAIYRSMHTNTIKSMNRLSDFEMPQEWEEFPTHEQMRQWLEDYVDHFDFRDSIRLDSDVVDARALPDGGWEVEIRDAQGTTQTQRYAALVAASGFIWKPRLPTLDTAAFAGRVIHSSTYKDVHTPVDVRGRRVVVAGIGNTGCELACEIAAAGAEAVFLAARSGTWILPRYENGELAAKRAPMAHPDEPLMPPFGMIPERWREAALVRVAGTMLKRSYGPRMQRFQELGLPPAPDNPFGERPTVNEELLGELEAGRVHARGALSALAGDEVVFADGRRERADYVICATGFDLSYPYLDACFVPQGARDLTLFQQTMHPERHDLFFIGVSRPMGALWVMAEVHARFVAALLSGRYALPSARAVRKRSRGILSRSFVSPAILGAAARAELARGAKRAGARAPTSD
ncbi:MAG: FAD-dependent oxidoreductase [Pseudomonadota bacterium]